MYTAIKYFHVSCVVLSISGFVLRWLLQQRGALVMQRRWVRVLPHVNDTLLLGSALTMAFMSSQYPFVAAWLTSKVLGLLAYIALGVVALRGPTARMRLFAFGAALAVFAWIVSVALSRHPAGIGHLIFS
jgi:uncharacterized membrane protein SirB2